MHRYVALLLVLMFSTTALSESFEVTVISSPIEDRLNAGKSFAGIDVEPQRPVKRAVELAIYESTTLFEAIGIQASVRELQIDLNADLQEQINAISLPGIAILDLPIETMERVAKLTDDMKIPAFNVRHSEVYLRESLCLSHLYHTIPSDRMYFDALGQFLIFRGWRKVLVVQGPSQRDDERAISLIQSLEKFGANIVDTRIFSLSHHPDDRDKNKPEFLTGGVSYDVVAVIDSQKDYGRYLQFSTRSARPVVGDVGLTPASWHFALERYGAPQLNERYRQFKPDATLNSRVAMTDAEFAAWSAVKLISNRINIDQTNSALDFNAVLSDPSSQVDLYKGTRGSIRQWNNQLRQPILLTTGDAVIAVAPMPKFLHPKYYVDTLGLDQPESICQLR